MNKFISTVVITTFTAVCSFGATAGSDSDKKDTMRKDSSASTSKKEGDKYEKKSDSASDGEMREKTLSEREKEYKDQEIMNKKPYKQ